VGEIVDIVVYGLINSSTLLLISIGFALAYGVSRVPNFAHGALYVVAGYFSWAFINRLGLNFVVSTSLSIILTAIIGGFIYRLILIRVRGMHASEIIASLAIGMAMMEFLRWVGIKGPTFVVPVFVEGMVEISGVPVDLQRVFLVATGVVLVVVLWIFTSYTRIGLSLKAVAQDERAALMLGIDSNRTAEVALGLGSAVVGVAANVVIPLSHIEVTAGYDALLNALAVCILGGLGSWFGAATAAFVIGYAQTITVYLFAPHFSVLVALLAIITILILKPSGLFGKQKELEERV
jgi:branched-chain amino acid transport system permease protein